MDFRQVVIESLDKLIGQQLIEAAIEKALAKTIEEIVQQELRSYSDFGKQLQAAVKKSLELHGTLELASYNQSILNIVKRQVEAGVNNALQREIAANLEDLLTAPPAEIRLSQVVEAFKKHIRHSVSGQCTCDDYHAIGLLIEEHSSLDGYWEVALDEDGENYAHEKKRKYDYDFRLCMNKEGQVYHLCFGHQDVEKTLFVGRCSDFERLLLQMKLGKTRVINDADKVGFEELRYMQVSEQ